MATNKIWIAVSAGNGFYRDFNPPICHTLALAIDGTLWAWGANYLGELGDGTTGSRSLSPVVVATNKLWVAVSAGGSHTLALATDGTLWAWGDNFYGQLGDGTTINRASPVAVATNRTWIAVSAGGSQSRRDFGYSFSGSHSLAVATDGTLWAWGLNDSGQLGDGTTSNRLSPVAVATNKSWTTVSGGPSHTLALADDGTLWAWGDNAYGELGNGTFISTNQPTQVGTNSDWGSLSSLPLPAPAQGQLPIVQRSAIGLTPQFSAGGSLQITLQGVSGVTYILEASTNMIDWTPISTNLSSGGVITVSDPAARTLPYRFYRAKAQ